MDIQPPRLWGQNCKIRVYENWLSSYYFGRSVIQSVYLSSIFISLSVIYLWFCCYYFIPYILSVLLSFTCTFITRAWNKILRGLPDRSAVLSYAKRTYWYKINSVNENNLSDSFDVYLSSSRFRKHWWRQNKQTMFLGSSPAPLSITNSLGWQHQRHFKAILIQTSFI